ncbi:MAG: hypothetical protein L0211_09590, partial [Planctomycetaceae bacterium]|nr:hypothetical protein [Planctomycetaceae bacterium]
MDRAKRDHQVLQPQHRPARRHTDIVRVLVDLPAQMLAAMKYSVMEDIPSIGTEANWGFMLGQFKWV